MQLGWRACVPVSLGAERFGVLDVWVVDVPSPAMVAESWVGLRWRWRSRRPRPTGHRPGGARPAGRPLSLPAEIQWELLPRLALTAPESVVAGTVEPAYDAGGDDYAAQPESLTVLVTDAMGDGLQAALLAGLAVAALCNARRRRAGLLEQVDQANRALHAQFGGERL